jgi:small subunit ribosomal protein S6
MRCYEHTFITRQDLSPQQAQALAETYTGVLTEHGAEVTKTEYWGLRNLSYRIRKNRKGHYLHLNLRASAEAVTELERQERLSDDVLRYLTVRVDELDDAPSILMQTRTAREDRSRRSHEDDDRPRRPRDDDDRPRRPRDDDDRPRRPRDDGERPRRASEDGAGRGATGSERAAESPAEATDTAESPARAKEAAESPAKAEDTVERPTKAKEAAESPAKAEDADGSAS